MRIDAWAITDIGRRRDHNEDSLLCAPELGLYVVADGMGGHRAGDRASHIAVETIERTVRAALPLPPSPLMPDVPDAALALLSYAMQEASRAILDEVERIPAYHGMGTTVSGLFFHDGYASVMHIGDSRIYRLREHELLRLTTDHSLVQEQVEAGLITEHEAQTSRFKNIITRSVGFDRDILMDGVTFPVEPGDFFLICSDGLSNFVQDDELREIIERRVPETALQFFVNLANSRGGDDNISAILIRIGDDPPASKGI